MEDLFDSGDEDTLAIAAKTSSKAIDSVVKTGYREGVQDGSESVFQEGFDRGYKQAFPAVFKIGVYKGLANCLLKDVEHPAEIKDILTNAKKGVCYVCKTGKENIEGNPQITIDDIETCQKEHENKILKILQDYFDPLFKERNVCCDVLNLPS